MVWMEIGGCYPICRGFTSNFPQLNGKSRSTAAMVPSKKWTPPDWSSLGDFENGAVEIYDYSLCMSVMETAILYQ